MADRPYMCRDEGLFLPECDDCSQLEGRVKALEDCCETATEELADHEERISSAETTLTNHTQTLSEQNTRITANSNSISANTQSIGQAESDINSVKSRVTTAESDIDTLQEDLMSAQSDIQSNTDAIDSIERLPEVTSADDGKVLTVVDGKWGIEPSSLVGEAIVGQSTVGEEETESDIDELKERMLSAESNIASLEENKQNKLTAGAGIQIQNDVISTTGSGDEGKADYTHIDECNDIVSFQADAKGVPLKSLTATINPKQSGSGDPSPDNVRPISGWDSVNVTRSGKNIYPTINSAQTYSVNGITFARNSDGSIHVQGTATANADFTLWNGIVNGRNAFAVKAGTYTISATGCSGDVSYILGGAQNTSGLIYNAFIESPKVWTVSIPHDGTTGYNIIRVKSGATVDTTISIQWELGSTATDYEPYQADTYTTTLPETVYGGSLDVVNGVLTVDRAMVDLGTLTWTYSNSFFRTDGIASAVKRPPNNQTKVNAISSAYPIMTWTAISGTDTAIAVDTTGRMIVANPSITSLSDFQTAISDVQLCYELAEPRTIQLTPKQVTTLLGTNNVWADSGEVCLEYEHTQGVPTLKARRTTYTTTESSEDTFALTDYTASDILFVYINGLMLVEGDEYTIEGTNVVLTTPITNAGTTVHIVALQAR